MNIVTRRNGRDQPDDADWLKNLPAIIRAAIAAEREACWATLDAMATRGESAEIRAAYSLGARAIRVRNWRTPAP